MIVFVGCGNMGEAILAGWLCSPVGEAEHIESHDVCAFVATEASAKRLHERYGIHAFTDLAHVPDQATMIVLAVKPQIIDEVMTSLRATPLFADEAHAPLVISVAAGITTDHIQNMLGHNVRVIRTMPNLPLKIGRGATGVCASSNATSELDQVCDLFSVLGRAVRVEETDMDAVCALSGSGPAYFAFMIETLARFGEELGLSQECASELALSTAAGTLALMEEEYLSPTELREAVSSPGGTTLAALKAMQENGFENAIDAGLQAAVKRSKELSQ